MVNDVGEPIAALAAKMLETRQIEQRKNFMAQI